MAELPVKVHLTPHRIGLRMRRPSVYQDEKQRMWLHFVMETRGILQVRLRQEDIPSGHIELTTNPLSSSTMPLLWTLQTGNQYLDCRCRFWRIVHHIKDNGVEEMILELMDDSYDI